MTVFSIIISLFFVIYSIFLFPLLYLTLFYGFPVSIKMKSKNLFINNIVLNKTILLFFLYFIIFIIPLILIYFFFNNYFFSCLGSYLVGIFYHFLFFNHKKNKEIFVRNYILDFGKYFNKKEDNNINSFFENYLK